MTYPNMYGLSLICQMKREKTQSNEVYYFVIHN